MATDVLARTRNTPPQITMQNPDERRRNIAEAFECIGDVSGQRVLLIDDVVTTGATIAACAKSMKEAGAASVWALALAVCQSSEGGYPGSLCRKSCSWRCWKDTSCSVLCSPFAAEGSCNTFFIKRIRWNDPWSTPGG